ncbi:MAG TPA: YceI family protein [Anditalea sp.]|nr:YceI family protein [Anditalea sp.]
MKILKLVFPLLIIAAIFQRCQENKTVDTYVLDADNSLVEWYGYSDNNTTSGSIKFTANDIKVEKGRIKSGTVTIPVSTITDFIHPEDLATINLEQIKNTEILDALLHPVIVFEIREVALLSGIHPTAVPGANWWIRGDMTMMGQTHQLSFPAKIYFNANDMEVEAKFTIDHTKWEMNLDNNPLLGKDPIPPFLDLYLKGKARINNKVII